jgi:SAM-dependent methyltransferase
LTENARNTSQVAVGNIDWGDLRNMNPVSNKWGFDRGLPIDRYFIEKFLRSHSGDIRGHCLEVMNNAYVKRFGGNNVSSCEVLDINSNNPHATIVGDLTDPETLGMGRFDCFVMTQTLPVIFDVHAAVRNAYQAVKPGGVLLLTAPALCRFSPHPEDHWRLTVTSLKRLLELNTGTKNIEMSQYGNLVCSLGFLIGAAAEELEPGELDHEDERFPIIVAARVQRETY